MISFQRLSILVGLVLVGLAITSLLTAAGVAIPLNLGGGGVRIPWQGAVAVLLAALSCAGADSIIRRAPQAAGWPLYAIAPYWALPGAITLTAVLFLASVAGTQLWVLALAATALALAGSLMGQLLTLQANHPHYGLVRLGLTLLALLVGLVLFSRIGQLKPIGLHGALGVGLLGAGLSLELLRQPDGGSRAIYPYSLVTGLVLTQVAWALDFLRISALLAGVFLLLLLYIMAGLGRYQLEGTLGYALVTEYAVIFVAALVTLVVLV